VKEQHDKETYEKNVTTTPTWIVPLDTGLVHFSIESACDDKEAGHALCAALTTATHSVHDAHCGTVARRLHRRNCSVCGCILIMRFACAACYKTRMNVTRALALPTKQHERTHKRTSQKQSHYLINNTKEIQMNATISLALTNTNERDNNTGTN
jgi:hypothetical protein